MKGITAIRNKKTFNLFCWHGYFIMRNTNKRQYRSKKEGKQC